MQQSFFWVASCLTMMPCILAPQAVQAANSSVWEAGNSLIDTTNYAGLAPYYWFANFGNANNVSNQPMDQNEARNLPSWLHFETRSACIAKDDGCVTADATNRTGFSFSENTTTLAGATSSGGPAFNTLTLPNASTGASGEAFDTLNSTGNTSSMMSMRILAGAPSSFRIWLVTDNGPGTQQARARVNLRNTTGPPLYGGDSDQVSGEALPGGQRLDNAVNPLAHDGTADAWAFLLSDVNTDDVVTFQMTGGVGVLPGFSGFMIQVVPEPTSASLLALGAVSFGWFPRRRHG
jgi:hypothetical protein